MEGTEEGLLLLALAARLANGPKGPVNGWLTAVVAVGRRNAVTMLRNETNTSRMLAMTPAPLPRSRIGPNWMWSQEDKRTRILLGPRS